MMQEFIQKFNIQKFKILDFRYWVVSVRPKQLTIGSLVISLKRECPELSGLKRKETMELAQVFTTIEKVLKLTFAYDKINYLALMMVDHQVHFHVIPRYEKPLELMGKYYKDDNWPGPIEIKNIIQEKDIEKKVYNKLKLNLQEEDRVVGYTTGVFDLFHIGHLNILKHAKENCDYLIVGVTIDELVSYKNIKNFIPFEERIKIVESIEYVDKVVPQETMDKMAAWKKLHFDKMFVGSDWKGTDKWNKFEEDFAKVGVEIKYFPYTKGTSSTKLRDALDKIRSI